MGSGIVIGAFRGPQEATSAVTGLRHLGYTVVSMSSAGAQSIAQDDGESPAIAAGIRVVQDVQGDLGATPNDFDAASWPSQAGIHIVTVDAPGREDEVVEALRRHGAYDVRMSRVEAVTHEDVVTDYTRLGSLDEGSSVGDSSGLYR